MPAWRCVRCEIDWPPEARLYSVCPGCEQASLWAPLGRPRVGLDEARTLAAQFRFGRYYAEHCKARGYDAAGPIPDALLTQTLTPVPDTIPDTMAA